MCVCVCVCVYSLKGFSVICYSCCFFFFLHSYFPFLLFLFSYLHYTQYYSYCLLLFQNLFLVIYTRSIKHISNINIFLFFQKYFLVFVILLLFLYILFFVPLSCVLLALLIYLNLQIFHILGELHQKKFNFFHQSLLPPPERLALYPKISSPDEIP